MSSEYDVLCVSHAPAILIETGEGQPAPAIERVQRGIDEHPACDLLVGRWSGALVEICCVGGETAKPHHPGWHRDPTWVDVGLVRIAALSLKYADVDPAMMDALRRLPICWSHDRLRSLSKRLEAGW